MTGSRPSVYPREESLDARDYVQVIRQDVEGGPAQWRWRVRAGGNHRILATSGEAYTSQAHCLRMARRLFPKLRKVLP